LPERPPTTSERTCPRASVVISRSPGATVALSRSGMTSPSRDVIE